jgi:hypothetical protein
MVVRVERSGWAFARWAVAAFSAAGGFLYLLASLGPSAAGG